MDQPMMDVLDGNTERALKYLFTTLMLATLRIGLELLSNTSHDSVTPREVAKLRGSDTGEFTQKTAVLYLMS